MPRPKTVEDLGWSIGPIERETLNDRVYRELKNSIMAGAFKPGAELTLRSVAEALGTSFMPVRDAMRRLVTERGLEMRPSRTIAIPILTADNFLELRRVRLLLEGEAVALAAQKISARQLGNVRGILKKLESLNDEQRGQFWALNLKLHFAIYEVGASPLLLSIIESLWLIFHRTRRYERHEACVRAAQFAAGNGGGAARIWNRRNERRPAPSDWRDERHVHDSRAGI